MQAAGAEPLGQFTGRFLLVYGDAMATADLVRSLTSGPGIRVAASSDFHDRVMSKPADASYAMVLETLKIAVVSAPMDQLDRMGVVAAGALLVPERFMYAAGTLQVTREYLIGYRDGVDAAVRTLLREPMGAIGLDGLGSHRAKGMRGLAAASGVTWNLVSSGAASSAFTGKNVRLAVLDTGLDVEHPDFKGRGIRTKSFVPDGTVADLHGHGTHCLGTAAGLAAPQSSGPRYGAAPDTEILVGKVLGDNGKGDEGWLLNGLEWAINEGARVVSISVEAPYDAQATVLPQYETLGGRALDAGTLVIAAAGNYSARPLFTQPVASPASASTIMSVGALSPDDTVAPFSCTSGPAGKVDIAAPGVSIESSAPLPRTRRVDSGTSMAAPLVAGIAALYCQADPALRGQALWDTLLRTARTVPGAAEDVGAGCVTAP